MIYDFASIVINICLLSTVEVELMEVINYII